jgi:hypothetical protein
MRNGSVRKYQESKTAFANHERAVRVFESCVGGEDRVVGLDNRARQLGGGVDAELELGLFAVVRGELLEKESTQTGTSSSTEGMEDKEALEARTVVSKTANLVHDGVNELLADGVVATGI